MSNKYKTIKFFGSTKDLFHASFEADKEVFETDGYPPKFLHKYCDGISLEIDLKTGQILNWNPPSEEEIEEYIEKNRSKF